MDHKPRLQTPYTMVVLLVIVVKVVKLFIILRSEAVVRAYLHGLDSVMGGVPKILSRIHTLTAGSHSSLQRGHPI